MGGVRRGEGNGFFFFQPKTAYEILPSLVGLEMFIKDRFKFPPLPESKITKLVWILAIRVGRKAIVGQVLQGEK